MTTSDGNQNVRIALIDLVSACQSHLRNSFQEAFDTKMSECSLNFATNFEKINKYAEDRANESDCYVIDSPLPSDVGADFFPDLKTQPDIDGMSPISSMFVKSGKHEVRKSLPPDAKLGNNSSFKEKKAQVEIGSPCLGEKKMKKDRPKHDSESSVKSYKIPISKPDGELKEKKMHVEIGSPLLEEKKLKKERSKFDSESSFKSYKIPFSKPDGESKGKKISKKLEGLPGLKRKLVTPEKHKSIASSALANLASLKKQVSNEHRQISGAESKASTTPNPKENVSKSPGHMNKLESPHKSMGDKKSVKERKYREEAADFKRKLKTAYEKLSALENSGTVLNATKAKELEDKLLAAQNRFVEANEKIHELENSQSAKRVKELQDKLFSAQRKVLELATGSGAKGNAAKSVGMVDFSCQCEIETKNIDIEKLKLQLELANNKWESLKKDSDSFLRNPSVLDGSSSDNSADLKVKLLEKQLSRARREVIERGEIIAELENERLSVVSKLKFEEQLTEALSIKDIQETEILKLTRSNDHLESENSRLQSQIRNLKDELLRVIVDRDVPSKLQDMVHKNKIEALDRKVEELRNQLTSSNSKPTCNSAG